MNAVLKVCYIFSIFVYKDLVVANINDKQYSQMFVRTATIFFELHLEFKLKLHLEINEEILKN